MKIPVPKPLLIVIVVIIILGVVSCGAGVFRGLNEEPEPSPENAASEAKVDGLHPGPVPAEDVRVTSPGSCTKDDADSDGVFDITITASCDATIDGQVLFPRRLSLGVVSNSFPGTIAVQQEIDGRLQPEDPESKVPKGGVVEISASGVGPVKIRILCGSCVLRIID